jgi:cobalt/nickel transport system permease protein
MKHSCVKHDFIDKYSHRDSHVHRVDARVKILCALAFILLATTFMNIYSLLFSLAVLSGLFLVARVPLSWGYSRALIVVPFAGTFALVKALTVPGTLVASWWIFQVTVEGLIIALQLLLRAYISVFAIVLLTSTTPFSTLLSALQRLRIPSIITSVLSFAYRYLFVFVDEVQRVERAKAARCIDSAATGLRLRATARTVGMVFIRAYERGERTYRSMVARGFEDKINAFDTLSIHKRDVILGCGFVAGIIAFTEILG